MFLLKLLIKATNKTKIKVYKTTTIKVTITNTKKK